MITLLFLLTVLILAGLAYQQTFPVPPADRRRELVRQVALAAVWSCVFLAVFVLWAWLGGVRGVHIPLPR